MPTMQLFLPPAAGKRLIARAIAARSDVQRAIREKTVVVVAGSTDGYLAEALLHSLGVQDFEPRGFYRGLLKPARAVQSVAPRDEDVVVVQGVWQRGATIYDVADRLGAGDLIFKGANAVHLATRTAGVIIGNPTSGTMGPIAAAVYGRRARLIHPVGVEKRVEEPVWQLARLCDGPGGAGFRLYPTVGEIYTELEALHELCGVQARILAAGGVAGYEGGCYFLCEGTAEEIAQCRALAREFSGTPPYAL